MLDVAIVGGGPGGLSAARRLAADGWTVTVFEEHDQVGTPVHCTGVLAEDVIASMKLPAEAVLNPLSTVRFVAPAGHSFDYTTASTEAVVIDREAFDSTLARNAEKAGVTCVPHAFFFGPGYLATLHAIAAKERPAPLERLFADVPFMAYAKTVPVVDGAIDVPERPGLGADPEEEMIERFRV
jgi:NAD(P)-dependent dehydrogenase (short-subunit alcohol dehydrogenase family)